MVRRLGWRSVARTDRGLVRPDNEDRVVDRPAAGLWAVADGMGGHARGEWASGLVGDMLESLAPDADLERGVALVRDGLAAVHVRLRHTDAGLCGSTVVALLIRGERFACLWAGDSRLYRLRGGRLELLTRDHSLVQELVEAGAIAPEAARTHPLANRITRAVGVGDRLELDGIQGGIAAGDRLLLSSDGLHGAVAEPALLGPLRLPEPAAAADGLMRAAFAAGAPDNVSLVLVTIDDAAAG